MKIEAENTAARTALWRALHVQADAPPPVLDDTIGLRLVDPPPGWEQRPDMSPFTRPFRASIVARARFVEDLVAASGLPQYLILGAGLDTFAQRRPDVPVSIFEIDQPGPQEWKRRRLVALGYGIAPNLHLVPVDFEAGDDWWSRLSASGFDAARPAVVASTGVSMYLTRAAIETTLRRIASLAPGSVLAMTFMLPLEMNDPAIQFGVSKAIEGAAAAGTPFLSFFAPADIVALARSCGFRSVEHVSADAIAARYFANRPDGLRPPPNSEEFIVART